MDDHHHHQIKPNNLDFPSIPSSHHQEQNSNHSNDLSAPFLMQQQMFGSSSSSSRMPFSSLNLYSAGDSMESRDYESEEGVGVSDEPAKPARRGSGSKRSRAAEVHNLSEKRRRSRINEKMKALQSLIPNSNKTDKASMLDEAIEYLKQLQLQVQMLSMRNGLFLHPSYLPGSLESHASQMCTGVGADNSTGANSGLSMLPVNQSFTAQLNRAHHHQPLVLPTLTNITVPEPSFHVESLRSNLGSFQLPESAEMILREEGLPKHQLTSGYETESLQDGGMKSTHAGTSQEFLGQPSVSSMANADNFDENMLSRQQSEDVTRKKTESHILMQQLHR